MECEVHENNASVTDITAPKLTLGVIINLQNTYSVAIVVGYVCLILNLLLLLVVKIRRKNQRLRLNYSFTTLFISSVSCVGGCTIRFLQEYNIPKLTSSLGCGIIGVSIRASVTIVPFTVVVVFRELQLQVQASNSLKVGGTKNDWWWFRPLLAWVIDVLISLPVFWTYKYNCSFSRCAQTVSFEWRKAYMASEVSVVILATLLPSAYMIYVLRKMGFKQKFLFFREKVPQGMENKVWRIRLVFLHVLLFIVTWVPAGLLILLRLFVLPFDLWFVAKPKTAYGSYTAIVILLFIIYVGLQPIIYLVAYHKLSFTFRFLAFCANKRRANSHGLLNRMELETFNNDLRMETVRKSDFISK